MTTKAKALPPLEHLRECFELVDGQLRWLKRPANHFRTKRAGTIWNGRYAGRRVGTERSDGYWQVPLCGRVLLVHRVVYALANGVDPVGHLIDHVDFNKSNNAPSNLRLATASQNQQNRSGPTSRSKTGIRGVTRIGKAYAVSLQIDGRPVYVGSAKSPDVAAHMAREARQQHYDAFAGRV